MSEASKEAEIISLEKEITRFDKGKDIIKKFNKNNIKLVGIDFFEFIKENQTVFDLVFIDGAKARYIDYIKEIEKYLNKDSIVIADNIYLRNRINRDDLKRSEKRMVKKMAEFSKYIYENFETIILDIGDGISISFKVS